MDGVLPASEAAGIPTGGRADETRISARSRAADRVPGTRSSLAIVRRLPATLEEVTFAHGEDDFERDEPQDESQVNDRTNRRSAVAPGNVSSFDGDSQREPQQQAMAFSGRVLRTTEGAPGR